MTKEEQIVGLLRQGGDAALLLDAILDAGVIGRSWSVSRLLCALAHLAAHHARVAEIGSKEWGELCEGAWRDSARYEAILARSCVVAGQALGAEPTNRGPTS